MQNQYKPLENIKQTLQEQIILRMKNPTDFSRSFKI